MSRTVGSDKFPKADAATRDYDELEIPHEILRSFWIVPDCQQPPRSILVGYRKRASRINNHWAEGFAEAGIGRFSKVETPCSGPGLITLDGCQDLVPHDTRSLLIPRLLRSEVVDIVPGFGTTFAAMPDLLAMLRRRSSAGMNPTMAALMGTFQILTRSGGAGQNKMAGSSLLRSRHLTCNCRPKVR
jgi:hypothetical protein